MTTISHRGRFAARARTFGAASSRCQTDERHAEAARLTLRKGSRRCPPHTCPQRGDPGSDYRARVASFSRHLHGPGLGEPCFRARSGWRWVVGRLSTAQQDGRVSGGPSSRQRERKWYRGMPSIAGRLRLIAGSADTRSGGSERPRPWPPSPRPRSGAARTSSKHPFAWFSAAVPPGKDADAAAW